MHHIESPNVNNQFPNSASQNSKLLRQNPNTIPIPGSQFGNTVLSKNQIKPETKTMPSLNQKVFNGLRRPLPLKHLTKKYGSKRQSITNLDYVSFLKSLLEGYDHRMRPATATVKTSGNPSGKIPTFVLIDMYINSLGGISEVTMDYETNIFLRLTWFDQRLNYQRYYDLEEIKE